MNAGLDATLRACGERIVSALAARFRDLDLAEEAFATACMRLVEKALDPPPDDVASWLYRAAERAAIDARRRARVRTAATFDEPEPAATAEDVLAEDVGEIPDERLRLVFVCCHPSIAPEARAALTLRIVLGLSTPEIARAFLVPEATLAQRLVRAKRKIAETGVPFEIPAREAWPERLDAVLTTVEIAYAKAHEDAAGTGPHASFGGEMLHLARVLVELLPDEPDILALAATIHYAEARRPARVDARGRMVPLAEQDPARWSRSLIAQGEAFLRRAARLEQPCARELEAAIHGAWCSRSSLAEPAPWPVVLTLYDVLLQWRDDPVVRVNRAVAVAEVLGPEIALAELDEIDSAFLGASAAGHAVRADLLRRLQRREEAAAAYRAALAVGVAEAERRWLLERLAEVESGAQ